MARLEASVAGAAPLAVLDRVITRQGLLEFRPLLDALVGRLQSLHFEVAVFGRVSSGKSSLLNHLAGTDALPVGVTPITAVPTRLLRGEQSAALISFAELPPRTVAVEQLRAYASEEGNPGNGKHVTGILVMLPSPRLCEGVVLVDTPGIGSLALSGSAETFAYLPRCDLGVVLVDAASTLTPDDLSLLRLLAEAAVPAQVVLSKADLLGADDRQRTLDYIRAQVRRELDLDLPVHPVSTVGDDEELLRQWFDREIAPLLGRHRDLAEASLRRKAAHLRESVVATLQTRLARRRGGPERPTASSEAVRHLLQEADEAVRQVRPRCLEWTADVSDLVKAILEEAASVAAPSVLAVAQRVLADHDRAAWNLAAGLQQALACALEALRRAAPAAGVEETTVRDVVFRGLPVPDLSPLAERLRVASPRWTRLLPFLAAWAMRRKLERRLGAALREQVDLHARAVRAWLQAVADQLISPYEYQKELFRARTLQRPDGETEAGIQELEADLGELLRDAPATA